MKALGVEGSLLPFPSEIHSASGSEEPPVSCPGSHSCGWRAQLSVLKLERAVIELNAAFLFHPSLLRRSVLVSVLQGQIWSEGLGLDFIPFPDLQVHQELFKEKWIPRNLCIQFCSSFHKRIKRTDSPKHINRCLKDNLLALFFLTFCNPVGRANLLAFSSPSALPINDGEERIKHRSKLISQEIFGFCWLFSPFYREKSHLSELRD